MTDTPNNPHSLDGPDPARQAELHLRSLKRQGDLDRFKALRDTPGITPAAQMAGAAAATAEIFRRFRQELVADMGARPLLFGLTADEVAHHQTRAHLTDIRGKLAAKDSAATADGAPSLASFLGTAVKGDGSVPDRAPSAGNFIGSDDERELGERERRPGDSPPRPPPRKRDDRDWDREYER